MIKLLFVILFSSLVFVTIPDPPINYLMEGRYGWRIDDPNGIPGKAILYYDLPPHFDGIPDLVLAYNVHSVNRKLCLKKDVMTEDYIFLNTACNTNNPIVYVLERPNFAARAFRDCEIRRMCRGWIYTEEK